MIKLKDVLIALALLCQIALAQDEVEWTTNYWDDTYGASHKTGFADWKNYHWSYDKVYGGNHTIYLGSDYPLESFQMQIDYASIECTACSPMIKEASAHFVDIWGSDHHVREVRMGYQVWVFDKVSPYLTEHYVLGYPSPAVKRYIQTEERSRGPTEFVFDLPGITLPPPGIGTLTRVP